MMNLTKNCWRWKSLSRVLYKIREKQTNYKIGIHIKVKGLTDTVNMCFIPQRQKKCKNIPKSDWELDFCLFVLQVQEEISEKWPSEKHLNQAYFTQNP